MPPDPRRPWTPRPATRPGREIDPAIVTSVLVLLGLSTVVLALAVFSRVG